MKTLLVMIEVKNEEKLEELYDKLEESMEEPNQNMKVTAYETYNYDELIPDIMKRNDNIEKEHYKNNNYNIIYPSFNENLSGDNLFELRVHNTMTDTDELYYAKDGFCKEFETLNEAYDYLATIPEYNK